MEDLSNNKMRATERALVIRKKPGVNPKSSSGLIDHRIFSSEGNTVFAIKDPQYNMWTFKYTAGALPEPLRQKFTKFNDLLVYGKQYFGRRGLEIVEVID